MPAGSSLAAKRTPPMRVLVSDAVSEAGLAVLEGAEGVEVDYRPGLPSAELIGLIGGYEGLVIRSGTKVTAEVIAAADRLQVVGRAGTGVDNVDLEAASRRGIVVMNTPGGNTVTTAEHTLAMLMAVSRHIPQANASTKAGRWEKKKYEGCELFEKTLGIVGLGAIGSVVASRAQGLKMKVLAYDPYLSSEAARRLGVELASLDEVFRRADYVTVHVPLSDDTRGLVDAEAISRMKDGVFILNCARGGIVDEGALLAGLRSGKVAGAAFDVFEQEPPPPDHPLLAEERFVCTPHLGASTAEAQENVAVAVTEQVVAYLTRGVIENAVNVTGVSREALEQVGPFISLAERLGSLVGQLGPRHLEELIVETAGALNELPVRPVALAALAGVLRHQLSEPVNQVNAPHLALDRGVSFTERQASAAGDFASLVTLRARGADAELMVCGTLFGRQEPRIVRYNQFDLEAVPAGDVLVIHNHDRPGVIGRIGTILGEAGVNIARMQLSLDRVAKEAMALVNVDVPVSDEVLAELRGIPHMISVEAVRL